MLRSAWYWALNWAARIGLYSYVRVLRRVRYFTRVQRIYPRKSGLIGD